MEQSSGTPFASTSASQYRPAEVNSDDDRPPQPFPDRTGFSHRSHFPVTEDEYETQRRFATAPGNDGSGGAAADDGWSCIIVIITFWMFVSMTMIFGIYGPETLWLGSNSSILMNPHPLFVDNVKVERLDAVNNGPILYGIYETPPLDVVTNWSENRKATLPINTHKEWMYYLNSGSEIEVSYNITSTRSSSLILVIAQGSEGLAQWLEDPAYPNTTLSWSIIHGTGMISQDIVKSSSYYIAVGNLNTGLVEIQLNIRTRAILYNTSNAYSKCNVGQSQCSVKIFLQGGNSALLETPILKPGEVSGKWHVKFTYGPRWITYLGSIGGITILMILSRRFFNNSGCMNRNESNNRDTISQRAPLISRKDDDLSSLGSSYDSVSQDDECDGPTSGSGEGNMTNDMRRLCAICFDAPRDSFFLPCGHCVACYACGMRILEAAGTCPICRRHMKKVRKIYTV